MSGKPWSLQTEVAVAKAVWALGYAVSHGPSLSAETANDLFNEIIPQRVFADINAIPYIILGTADYLTRFPGASAIRRCLANYAKTLCVELRSPDWLELWNSPDLGVPIQALAIASHILSSNELQVHAKKMAEDLRRENAEERCS